MMKEDDEGLISQSPIPRTHIYVSEKILHEWQLCPKCSGQGIVSKPPWIAGDINTWSASTTAPIECDLCNGKKIISKINGLPPI